MKVAVRCKDGTKRMYVVADDFPYDEVAAAVTGELPEAVTVLVEVVTKPIPILEEEAA